MKAIGMVLAAGLIAASGSALAADYHVAPEGDDRSNGRSEATAWASFAKAASEVRPGDRVIVHGGVYQEFLTPQRSGTADRWIEFAAASGETPVIDGTFLTLNGAQQGAIYVAGDIGYVRFQGFEVRNLSNDRSSQWAPTAVAVRDQAHHIELIDCNLHTISTGLANRTPKGISIEGRSHNITIRGGKVSQVSNTAQFGNAHAIAVFGRDRTPVDYVAVEGVEIFDLTLGESEALVFNGNVTNFRAVGNRIYDSNNIGIDVIGFEGVGPAGLDQARNGLIADNVIHDVSSRQNPAYLAYTAGGIYVDGGRDVIIERNQVYQCDIGVELASESPVGETTGITMRDNVIWRNSIGGLLLGGYEVGRGATEDCLIVNNTFFENDTRRTQLGEVNIRYKTNRNVFKNNVFNAGPQGWFVTFPREFADSEGNVFDRNCYFSAARSLGWEWRGRWATSLSSFQTMSGQEETGIFKNPRFQGLVTDPHGLQLAVYSPLIDAGAGDIALPSESRTDAAGEDRFVGDRIDIGAYEYGGERPGFGPRVIRRFQGAVQAEFSSSELPLEFGLIIEFSRDGREWSVVAERSIGDDFWVWAEGVDIDQRDRAVTLTDWRGLSHGFYRSSVRCE